MKRDYKVVDVNQVLVDAYMDVNKKCTLCPAKSEPFKHSRNYARHCEEKHSEKHAEAVEIVKAGNNQPIAKKRRPIDLLVSYASKTNFPVSQIEQSDFRVRRKFISMRD